MEEIEVGEYVRTKEGYIGKIIRLGDEFSYDCIYESGDFKYAIGLHSIAKHSPNIIDLIETGDYVNGRKMKILKRDEFEGKKRLVLDSGFGYETWLYEHQIEDMATHEQVNSIKYVIGE